MTENSHAFFANTACRYYPCHSGIDGINCLFCFCPLYTMERCPGKPEMIEANGKTIKSCMNCTFPHRAKNYEKVLRCLSAPKRDD